MDVDRATFLILTSAIFTACAHNEAPTAPGAVVEIPRQPPLPPSKDTSAVPAPIASSPPEPVAAPQEDDDETPYEPWPGTADPPLAKSVHGQKCEVAENAKGKAVSCLLKPPPGPACESFSSTRSDCARLSRWLVPRVAEKAAACLQAKSGKRDICLFNTGASCFIESLSSVCVDPSPKIESACTRVMQKCSTIDKRYRHMTMDACRAALSAIVPTSHGKFISCATESCDLIPCHYAAQR